MTAEQKLSVVFDMDGTLSDVEHRRDHIRAKPKNWAAWNAGMGDDKPRPEIVHLAQMYHRDGFDIIVCTGREENARATTESWMLHHGVPCHRLYMRPNKDYRADDIVKGELLVQIKADGFDPKIAVDDRDRVVDMWRAAGLICLQCAKGDF